MLVNKATLSVDPALYPHGDQISLLEDTFGPEPETIHLVLSGAWADSPPAVMNKHDMSPHYIVRYGHTKESLLRLDPDSELTIVTASLQVIGFMPTWLTVDHTAPAATHGEDGGGRAIIPLETGIFVYAAGASRGSVSRLRRAQYTVPIGFLGFGDIDIVIPEGARSVWVSGGSLTGEFWRFRFAEGGIGSTTCWEEAPIYNDVAVQIPFGARTFRLNQAIDLGSPAQPANVNGHYAVVFGYAGIQAVT